MKGASAQKEISTPFSQVNLLETLFGIDAQPVTEQSRVFSTSQEPGSQGALLADTIRP
jgi:hypothetical protein